MAGTSEGARKAARTRGRESLAAAGRKGGKNSRRGSNQNNMKQKKEDKDR
jgi:hypothetical protein